MLPIFDMEKYYKTKYRNFIVCFFYLLITLSILLQKSKHFKIIPLFQPVTSFIFEHWLKVKERGTLERIINTF